MYYFWLGFDSDKIEWYAKHYKGLPFQMHTAQSVKSRNEPVYYNGHYY